MLNYQKLMDRNPTSYGKMINDQGQEIEFFEHPIFGDETEVIVVCHELKLASYSTFFETYDMTAEHGEYQPSFVDGQLQIGVFIENSKIKEQKEILRLFALNELKNGRDFEEVNNLLRLIVLERKYSKDINVDAIRYLAKQELGLLDYQKK